MGRCGGATLGPFAFGDAAGFGGVTITRGGCYSRRCGVCTLCERGEGTGVENESTRGNGCRVETAQDEQQFLPEQEIEGKMEGEMKREGGRGEEVIEMEGGLSE